MIDKIFDYVQFEFESINNVLTGPNAHLYDKVEVINKARDRAFGAVTFLTYSDAMSFESAEKRWTVWAEKFDSLY